jgi:DNA-binding CsgD family transcriptional regulator
MLEQGPPSVQQHGCWILVLSNMADGQAQLASKLLNDVCQTLGTEIVPLFPVRVGDEIDLVRVALGAGDSRLVEVAMKIASNRANLNPGVASLAAVFHHTNGLANDDAREFETAIELLRNAKRPLMLASALEDLGAALAASGEGKRASDPLIEALALYARSGASWDAARTRRRLRSLGVRPSVSQPRDETDQIMTESELKVARLVAQGFTNREVAERLFISPHTVSGHLRHLFLKLEINSRVELVRIMGKIDGYRGEPG